MDIPEMMSAQLPQFNPNSPDLEGIRLAEGGTLRLPTCLKEGHSMPPSSLLPPS